MQTPIFDFVQQYQQSDTARFHMPGHKGQSVLGCEGLDITEIAGADNLQHPEHGGIIAQSEQNVTDLFGTARTYYSAGGSSACISAMLYLAKLAAPAARKGRILAGRNAHKVFLQCCALLDIAPTWIYPSPEMAQGLCACPIAPLTLETILAQQQAEDALPMAVYVTSPDYLGNLADVAGLAAVCARYALPLLVDNAHGAYLKFLQPSMHPIDQGAAMCADSAHKTLPVLTGGAYLHVAKESDLPMQAVQLPVSVNAEEVQTQVNALSLRQTLFCENAKAALSLFSSTSPSYLILQSLDLCNAALAGEYPADLEACVAQVSALKEKLSAHGYTLCDGEPLKITVDCRMDGGCIAQTGETLADHLRSQGIEVEFADPDFLVCMCSVQNSAADFARLEMALCAVSPQHSSDATETVKQAEKENVRMGDAIRINSALATIDDSETSCGAKPQGGKHKQYVTYLHPHDSKCDLREALFSTGEEILVENAVGKTCRMASVSCPPAIPIVVSGEVITKADVTLFQYYGIETVNVIKED